MCALLNDRVGAGVSIRPFPLDIVLTSPVNVAMALSIEWQFSEVLGNLALAFLSIKQAPNDVKLC